MTGEPGAAASAPSNRDPTGDRGAPAGISLHRRDPDGRTIHGYPHEQGTTADMTRLTVVFVLITGQSHVGAQQNVGPMQVPTV